MSLSEPTAGEAPEEQEASRLVGTVLAERYRLDKVLGLGGMGAVYRAEHLLMHKRVAIKVLHPEMIRMPEVVQRFEREAMAAAHIEHPNVATATDFGQLADGSFFLVLEFVEGRSLRETLEAGGALSVDRAVHVTRQILLALVRAHGLGIVHRDLKPENVMLVEREGDPDFVKVLDFGIAKVDTGALSSNSSSPVGAPAPKRKATAALTQLGMVYGTPEYMAPEQALGQDVDHRADLYALGVMLFEMLVGQRPFDADNPVQILGMVVSQPVPTFASLRPDLSIPAPLEEVTRTLLSKLAKDRYDDARAARAALDVAMGLEPPPPSRLANSSPSDPRLPGSTGASRALSGIGQLPTAVGLPPPPRGLLDRVRPLGLRARDQFLKLPQRVQLAAGAGGLALLLLVIVLAVTRSSAAPGKGGAGIAVSGKGTESVEPAVAEKPASGVSDEDIRSASAQGIGALEALRDRAPRDPRVLRALARAQLDGKQPAAAVTTYGALLEADPAAATDKSVESGFLAALQQESDSEAGVGILVTWPGSEGPDLLFELSGSRSPRLAKRAREALARPEVLARASPSLKAALDLRALGKGGELCKAHKSVFAAARDGGDARALPFLRPLVDNHGCGFLRRGDCYSCLRGDGLLNEAIAAIQAREKKAADLTQVQER